MDSQSVADFPTLPFAKGFKIIVIIRFGVHGRMPTLIPSFLWKRDIKCALAMN